MDNLWLKSTGLLKHHSKKLIYHWLPSYSFPTIGHSVHTSNESFLSGNNANYLEQLYEIYQQDPSKINPSLAVYFKNIDEAKGPGEAFQNFPGLQTNLQSTLSQSQATKDTLNSTNVIRLIRAHQSRGHEFCNLDPLGIDIKGAPDVLDFQQYGFTENDLDKIIYLSKDITNDNKGVLSKSKTVLRDLLKVLKSSYSNTLGVEYMHINDSEKRNFIREHFEDVSVAQKRLSNEEKLQTLERLVFAVMFEEYLAKKWNTAKRFGLEGCESFIPGFKMLIDQATLSGVKNVVIGMPHRGRLNVIANVVRKDMHKIFMQFKGSSVMPENMFTKLEKEYGISGDVKYHLGMTYQRKYPDGRTVELSLAANPSHLEAVDPIVVGKARAKMYYEGDKLGEHTLPVLIHGDAAFSAQGVVYETMNLSNLPEYGTGGTIHILVNNQIGFTTFPYEGRSTRYCTDIGRAFDCPIFHINGDDVLSVAYAFKCAALYRQKFHTDVILDVVGYRRNGHNEMDQPMFTQPEMYSCHKKNSKCS